MDKLIAISCYAIVKSRKMVQLFMMHKAEDEILPGFTALLYCSASCSFTRLPNAERFITPVSCANTSCQGNLYLSV